MTKIAVVFHSGYGHTARVAEHVQKGAASTGATVDLVGTQVGLRPVRVVHQDLRRAARERSLDGGIGLLDQRSIVLGHLVELTYRGIHLLDR